MKEQNNFFMLFLTQIENAYKSKKMSLKYLSIFFVILTLFFSLSNFNKDYANCMKATKHNYITKAGIDHISAQCEAFIKDRVMVK